MAVVTVRVLCVTLRESRMVLGHSVLIGREGDVAVVLGGVGRDWMEEVRSLICGRGVSDVLSQRENGMTPMNA